MIKVSSITYVRNGEQYIEECLRSVMKQSLKEIEIIVVDGNSDDLTVPIIKRLMNEDRRIKLLEVAGSVGAQFNVALETAKGEYIAVCEGDDKIADNKYEMLYELAHKNNLDIIRACYDLWFQHQEKDYLYKVEVAPMKEIYNITMKPEKGNLFFLTTFVNGFWNGLYSRDFLIKNNIRKNETRGAAFQDITFSFMTQLYAKKYMFVPDSLHYYRIDNPNSSVNSEKCMDMLMTEYDLLRKCLTERKLWDDYKQEYLYWVMTSVKQFMDRNVDDNKILILKKIFNWLQEQGDLEMPNRLSTYVKIRRVLEAYFIGEDEFIRCLTANDKQTKQMMDFFLDDVKKCDVLIFGAGHFGCIISEYLKLLNVDITFLDNNQMLQNEGVNGHKVKSPCRENIKDTDYIVVANVNNSSAMCKQLMALGIANDKIIVCDNEDVFIREIYMKYKISFLDK